MRWRWAAIAACLLMPWMAMPAQAHPHVWVEAKLVMSFVEARLERVHLTWTFDELFTGWLLQDHTPRPDGSFEPAIASAIERDAFQSIAELGFFTQLRIDGEPRPLREFAGFEPRVTDGRLVYTFALPLAEPIDPRAHKVTVGLFDETYYVDLMLAGEAPVQLAGAAPAGCSVGLREDAANPIYFGMVTPVVAELTCAP